MGKKFSILITTKNRIEELKITLQKITHLLERNDVQCIICDDGSTDQTSNFLQNNYPNIQLIRNEESKGLIYSRNKLMELVEADFAISLDDDLHFITSNPLEVIEHYFSENPICGLISFRIFWSKQEPISTNTKQKPARVQSFAGGAHVWRMSAWNSVPDYPSWFVFYGEEEYLSFHLYKKNIEIHYLPDVLTHHRVNVLQRKQNKDFLLRKRLSLKSGWYIFLLFYPINIIPRRFAYSIWQQIKVNLFKGNFKVILPIFQAFSDVICNFRKIYKHRNGLSNAEFVSYYKINPVTLYWKPEDEN